MGVQLDATGSPLGSSSCPESWFRSGRLTPFTPWTRPGPETAVPPSFPSPGPVSIVSISWFHLVVLCPGSVSVLSVSWFCLLALCLGPVSILFVSWFCLSLPWSIIRTVSRLCLNRDNGLTSSSFVFPAAHRLHGDTVVLQCHRGPAAAVLGQRSKVLCPAQRPWRHHPSPGNQGSPSELRRICLVLQCFVGGRGDAELGPHC